MFSETCNLQGFCTAGRRLPTLSSRYVPSAIQYPSQHRYIRNEVSLRCRCIAHRPHSACGWACQMRVKVLIPVRRCPRNGTCTRARSALPPARNARLVHGMHRSFVRSSFVSLLACQSVGFPPAFFCQSSVGLTSFCPISRVCQSISLSVGESVGRSVGRLADTWHSRLLTWKRWTPRRFLHSKVEYSTVLGGALGPACVPKYP